MSAAKRAKLEAPMNGNFENSHDNHNGVEHETDAGSLSSQEIMALRAAHIG